MVAIMFGADNGFFYAGQVVYFSSPFTVFLIYHKQLEGFQNRIFLFEHLLSARRRNKLFYSEHRQ